MPGMEAEFAATMAKRQAAMNEKNNKVFLEICYFEFSVIVAIFINSLFLAAYDPLEEEGGPNNVMCDSAGKLFTIVFTLEMCVKMIDQGVVFGSVRNARFNNVCKSQSCMVSKSPMICTGMFFITFIMFGSFFMLELFVSAIVAAYTMMNEATDGSAFQSERQRRVVANMVLGKRDDNWTPEYEWQMPLFRIIQLPTFENAIIACIVLNTAVMALYFDGMDVAYSDELDFWNSVFTFIFLLECIFKMAALSPNRFFNGPSAGWNRFDFGLGARVHNRPYVGKSQSCMVSNLYMPG